MKCLKAKVVSWSTYCEAFKDLLTQLALSRNQFFSNQMYVIRGNG